MTLKLDQYEVSFKNFSFGSTRILPRIISTPSDLELDEEGDFFFSTIRSIEVEFEIDSPGRGFLALNGSSGSQLKINPEIFRQEGELFIEINGEKIFLGPAMLHSDFPDGNRLHFSIRME